MVQRASAYVYGHLNDGDDAGVRRAAQSEQQCPRIRFPRKAFDVQTACVGFPLSGGGDRRHEAQQPVAESVHRFCLQIAVVCVADANQSITDLSSA